MSSVQSVNVEHIFSQNWESHCFHDSFFLGGGGGGSNDIIVSDRWVSEKFFNPAPLANCNAVHF